MKNPSEKVDAIYLKGIITDHAPTLLPTQPRLCIPIIARIYRKMLIGFRFRPIHVAEGMIIDGHHRYVAALAAGYDLESIPSTPSSVTQSLAWPAIDFVEEDWDTEAKIRLLNEHDAHYNDLPLHRFIDLLK